MPTLSSENISQQNVAKMLISRASGILLRNTTRLFERKQFSSDFNMIRYKTTKRSGAILEEPYTVRFGLIGVVCTVIPGLLIGAIISKYIANFLEENDLFVPSDDDDDDD